jgi:hypothetical protein
VLRAALTLLVAAAMGGGSSPLPGTASARDRAAWRALLHWPASCEASWRSSRTPGAGIGGVWTLAGGRRLVAVDCTLGAYQGTSMLYLLDAARRSTGPLVLRIYRDLGSGKPTAGRTTLVLGTLTFSTRTRTLTVLDKFRGVGDCGLYSVFRLSGERLVAVTARAKLACDGKPPYDPRRWPPLRRS